MILMSPFAAMAAPPTVITLGETNVTATTLTGGGGNVTSLGTAANITVWGLQYGTTTVTYDSWYNITTGSPKIAPYSFSQNMSSLTQGNAYYYRAFSSSDIGMAYGSEIANITKPYPPTALTAVSGAPTSVTLSFTPSAVGAGATAYSYCRYSETDYPATVSDGSLGFDTTALSATVAGLSSGHSYYFRIWAYATEGGLTSAYSDTTADISATPSYSGFGAAETSIYENSCTVAGGTGNNITVSNWGSQTFTVGTTAHTVYNIQLKLLRVGVPGDVTVSIKRVQSGVPYGSDLCYGTSDGDVMSTSYAWYNFVMNTETSLEPGQAYAITVRASSAGNTTANYIQWSRPSAYSYGDSSYSSDNGYSWTSYGDAVDHCFEIWGRPCLQMISAKVFQNYITTGDWVIVFHYNNVFPPYYPGQNVKTYFTVQLIDGSTVVAQTACPSWNYRPGSLYLSPAMVIPLEWGHPYRLRLIGTYASPPYAETVLDSSTWSGTATIFLDSYVLSIASLMENYYNTAYTTYLQDLGQVFNAPGGVIFSSNIAYLSTQRPNLFSIATAPVAPATAITGTQELQRTVDWEIALGPYVSSSLTEVGGFFGGVDGQTVGGMLCVLVYILIAGFAFSMGQSAAALIIAFPIFLGGALLGIVPMGVLFVALAIASFLLVFQLWLGRG
jgi:hypothetical protein